MKLSTLLSNRGALLQQARLSNLAFAYAKLSDFTTRIDRARLHGAVTLQHAAPDVERYQATLVLREGNQSVVEEHFTEEDVMDLADVIAFLSGQRELDLTFPIEEMKETFLAPLRLELERNGVKIDAARPPAAVPDGDGEGSHGCPQVDEKS